MYENKQLSNLKEVVCKERELHKNPKSVRYSRKVIKLTQRLLQDPSLKKCQIQEVTGLSSDFVRRCFCTLKLGSKKIDSKFKELKIIKESESLVIRESLEVETLSGLKIKNISLERIVRLEKLLSCY